ncbi:nucleotidyltransferase family protein [Sneathiella glossodoripedis]|uniref:nucleotidyltransferase family protein n=1 Tax=Sneathiella glossodoripedis TaxID=418853 RepID=UPI000471748D|nr:nucleotidyltransferase family protein [Sneathiella glossodoripedis]
MEALLLSAGLGTRLRPLTDKLPKCLMPIWGRPIIGIWLEMLRRTTVKTVFINLHHLAPMVREYIESSPYKDMVYFLDEPLLLGTAGTISRFRSAFNSEDLLVAHADNLSIFSLENFQNTYLKRAKDVDITMMTFTTETPESCGIIERDSSGRVIKFIEKPKQFIGNLANGAVYIMHLPTILEFLDQRPTASDLSTEVLPHFVNRMNCFHNSVYHQDIGNISALANAQIDIEAVLEARSIIKRTPVYWTADQSRQSTLESIEYLLSVLEVEPSQKSKITLRD